MWDEEPDGVCEGKFLVFITAGPDQGVGEACGGDRGFGKSILREILVWTSGST